MSHPRLPARCSRCTWPLCGPQCEASAAHQPECEVTKAAGITISLNDANGSQSQLYELVTPLRWVRGHEVIGMCLRSPERHEDDNWTEVDSWTEDMTVDSKSKVPNKMTCRNYLYHQYAHKITSPGSEVIMSSKSPVRAEGSVKASVSHGVTGKCCEVTRI